MADLPNTLAEFQSPITAWEPLQEPLFRRLWIASLISYTGTWMHNLGAGWLMTSLTMTPWKIALVQAATSLPVLLVALPAGALADMMDRRRLLLIAQSWMAAAALLLAVLTYLGRVTPAVLLALTFLLGIGAVMNDPAWQAINPEVISPRRLEPGIALQSAGFNIARAVGPAIGGVLIQFAGTAWVFLLNSLSFLGVILFLRGWKRPALPTQSAPFHRHIFAGFGFMRTARPMQSVLIRTLLFSFFASALWALLPFEAQPFGATGFGFLLGSFGVGALAGAIIMPHARRAASTDVVVAVCTLLFAGVVFTLGLDCTLLSLCLALFCGGAAWIMILASLNVCAQTMAPDWVRARSLSFYVLALQGGLALGSPVWGIISSKFSCFTAFSIASGGLVLGLALSAVYRLQPNSALLAASASQNS